jgi:undecaprenyl-diphosphatase
MSQIIYSIILGAVQGITEFLPISSTGHLIIFRDILGLNVSYGLVFDAILQLGTALAVLIYFWKDLVNLFRGVFIKREDKQIKLFKFLIIGTVPAILIGFAFQKYMETTFRSTVIVAMTLILGSIIMYFSERFIKQNELNNKKSFVIGLFQSLAIVPGMSRSGMTISGAYFLGVQKDLAVRFSFLLSVPIIWGTGLYSLLKLFKNPELFGQIEIQLLFGFVSSFIFGLLSIKFLINFLKSHSFKGFIIYRIALAVLLIIFSVFSI